MIANFAYLQNKDTILIILNLCDSYKMSYMVYHTLTLEWK